MSRKTIVHWISLDKFEVREVGLKESRVLVQHAYKQGKLVVDKNTGDIIDDIGAATKEAFIAGVLGGAYYTSINRQTVLMVRE